MKAEVFAALGHALSVSCDGMDLTIDRFIEEAATELRVRCLGCEGALALVACKERGSACVGLARGGAQVPHTILAGLVAECRAANREYVVKDHALQQLCCLASEVRASLTFTTNGGFNFHHRYTITIWVGFETPVTVRLMERVQAIARAVAEWFDVMHTPFERLLAQGERTAQHHEYKREVLAVLHDVRAPLGALRYGLALSTADTVDRDGYATEITYIEELLSDFVSRTSSSAPVSVGCDVSAVARAVVSRLSGCAREAQVTVQLKAPYCAMVSCLGRIELERVLTNVISNALTYSGGTRVSVQVRQMSGAVQVEVSDDGVGIPTTVAHYVNQDEVDVMPGANGWGIGLTSSKRLLSRAGGFMRVLEGSEGGATILMSLPSARSCTTLDEPSWEVREASPAERSQQSGLFLVDDDPDHNASLGRLLVRRGIEVRSFSSIAEAVAALPSNGRCPIVCDINMPDGGAERLLASVRDKEQRVPIAVISGESDEARLYRLAARGAEAFFTKPVNIDQVVEWVGHVSRGAVRGTSLK